ncbi:recombinase family protein [Thiotrichales bacterium 19S9-12]|nr:recombinase family protein [Thiotrichales bacterium 19S9-11]MCF6811662.1 recombinase family protein [Thiotrichales bacterium 19S9-12]
MIFAYARVSTQDQNIDSQIEELKKYGYDQLFQEKASGVKADRPALKELIAQLREGDTVLIYRLDRLGRSLKHLIEIVEQFQDMGVNLISITDSINTSNASGKLVFHIFGAMADFERNLIKERTRVGLNAARARGRLGGRKKGLSEDAERKAKLAYKLYQQKDMTISEICEALSIGSRNTVYRYIEWVENKKNINK